ncbi:unnamed protein product (macronuclear) [Paramecium tetraurelia]|uniref:non-specific serine/threonine protein kinase n=1 Tax=Paramecium tetraurelia TaxID=5888 RepID=A0EGJ7_PARTE|nr:uncharacterized protein GSPATT00026762001 [Paramecium tetraurelia]CAK94438.1 unnamed protein product [Paramecium tetraurelia]|eukprot:XP_001461811.1 hypothetical protein (macronuclear) [Paramecium tetraurelia strain d4-2]
MIKFTINNTDQYYIFINYEYACSCVKQSQNTIFFVNLKLVDFDIIKPLGKDAYSEVFLVKNKLTGHESALKIVDKNFLLKEKKKHHAYIEREVLSKLRHQGIIKLFNSFEEHDKLFYCLEVLTDGNLLEYMNRHILNGSIIMFYAAELIDWCTEMIIIQNLQILEQYLFMIIMKLISEINQKILGLNIKNKDLLLQTILRNPKLSIAVILVLWLIDYNVIGPQADLWALGCFIYQLYTNKTPFYSENEFELFNNISQCSWSQDQSIPNDALDLIKILLDKDPIKRFLGEFDDSQYHYERFKQHQFFRGISFKQMWLQDVPVINNIDQHKRKTSRIQTTFIESNRALRDKYDNQGISQIIMQGQLDKEHGVLFMTQFSLRYASIVCQDEKVLFVYINPQLNNKKTVIPLNQCTSCKLLGKGKFIVADRNKKKYIFKQRENNVPAQQWVNLINKYIKSNHY